MILVIYGLVCWYILLIYEILKYWVGIKALFVLICVLYLGKGQTVKTCECLATRFEFFFAQFFFPFFSELSLINYGGLVIHATQI